MSILVRFTGAPGLTAEKYDATMPLIEASGEFPPDGLSLSRRVQLGRFVPGERDLGLAGTVRGVGQRLMPILDAERRRARGSARGDRDP